MTVTDVETADRRVDVEPNDVEPDTEQQPNDTYGALAPGTRVEVRSSFDKRWSDGFEVLSNDGDGYRLRRLSDGAPLPTTFRREDIRRERRRGQWWY